MIINIDDQGDPIYAGMDIIELIANLPVLASQMPESQGHFYYAEPSMIGNKRRNKLAEKLYNLGLR